MALYKGRKGYDGIHIRVSCVYPEAIYQAIAAGNVGPTVIETCSNFKFEVQFLHFNVIIITIDRSRFPRRKQLFNTGGFRFTSNYGEDSIR